MRKELKSAEYRKPSNDAFASVTRSFGEANNGLSWARRTRERCRPRSGANMRDAASGVLTVFGSNSNSKPLENWSGASTLPAILRHPLHSRHLSP